MFQVFFITVTLIIHSLAYHDPDLNYHISQAQKLDCGDAGYSYPAPSVQLTTTGVKYAQNIFAQPLLAPAYQYSKDAGYGYTQGAYQAVAPKLTYAAQPAATYANYDATASSYATQTQGQQKEFHGYATTAGLSSVGTTRTVIPQATYAQAPIIAKITAAPLVAKFAISPAKTTYVTQVAQQAAVSTGSLAKASLNSYNVQSGPVVTQLFAAAPAARYATSPALRVQQVPQIGPARYTTVPAPIPQYAQVQPISALTPVAQVAPQYRASTVTQYATSSAAQVSSPSVQYSAPITQYTTQHTAQQYVAPAVTQQYVAPALTQYAAPAVTQYASPIVTKYAAPAFTQYSTVAQNAAPLVAQYTKPGVSSIQYASAPIVQQVSAPARVAVAPVKVKNVHTEFIENYVSNSITFFTLSSLYLYDCNFSHKSFCS